MPSFVLLHESYYKEQQLPNFCRQLIFNLSPDFIFFKKLFLYNFKNIFLNGSDSLIHAFSTILQN